MARDIDKMLQDEEMLRQIRENAPVDRAYRAIQSRYPRNSFEEILAEKEGQQLTSTPANLTYAETKGLPPLPREKQPLTSNPNLESLEPDPKAFELGQKIGKENPEVAAKAINNILGGGGGGGSDDYMKNYRQVMADRERRFSPLIEPMKTGLGRLEDLIENYKNQTSGVSMKPMAALADAWSKNAAGTWRETNLAGSMEAAPDPKQRAGMNVEAEKLGQGARDQLLDSVIKAYQTPSGLDGGQAGQQDKEVRLFMDSLNKQVIPAQKELEDDEANLKHLENVLSSGDIAKITASLESFARTVNKIKGAGTEGDVARQALLDFENKLKVAAQKTLGERRQYTSQITAPMLELLRGSRAENRQKFKNRFADIQAAYENRALAQGLNLMNPGHPGHNTIYRAIEKTPSEAQKEIQGPVVGGAAAERARRQ